MFAEIVQTAVDSHLVTNQHGPWATEVSYENCVEMAFELNWAYFVVKSGTGLTEKTA